MIKYLFILFICCTTSLAQTLDENALFNKAAGLFEKENYAEALLVYNTLETQGVSSESLFYNLANTHYKLHDTTAAIYYYEKALLINPAFEPAKINLKFAEQNLSGSITKIIKFTNKDILHSLFRIKTYDQWAWFATLSAYGSLLFFIGFYFMNHELVKRYLFAGIFICMTALLAFSWIAYSEKEYEDSFQPAIVFTDQALLKEDPVNSSSDISKIDAGSKVYILEKKALWAKVKLENQVSGWMLQSDFKSLK